MNYAQTAQRYWETYLPSRAAEVKDPETFYRDLASQVRSEIAAALVTARPEAGLPENATYLQVKAAHEGVRKAAEERALNDLVFLTPEPGTEDRRMAGTVLPGWEDDVATPEVPGR